MAGTDRLENFPSYFVPGGNDGSVGGGQGWLDATMEQAVSFGAKFVTPKWMATGLVRTKLNSQYYVGDPSQFILEVHLSANGSNHSSKPTRAVNTKVHARVVIVASGSLPRKLDLPHETILWGHSLHNCALCDGDAYVSKNVNINLSSKNSRLTKLQTQDQPNKGKSVAVIGGGDAAVEAISLLARLNVETIHWIHRRTEFKASPSEVKRVSRLPNVQIWIPYVVVEWVVKESGDGGDGIEPAPLALDGVRIAVSRNGVADPEATSSLTIPCDGAFLMIGSTPNTKWLKGSGMDIDPMSGLIRLMSSITPGGTLSDRHSNGPLPYLSTATSISGVFAAGEAVDGIYRQALTAASEGAKAAMDAERYLRQMDVEERNSGRGIPEVERGEDHLKQHPEMVEDTSSKQGEDFEAPVDCDLTKVDCIKLLVSTHPIVIFSKPFCPYCRRALEALRSEGTEPLVVDLTELKEGWKVQEKLASMTGRRTVPNVFVGGKSIGGSDETRALSMEGELGVLLREAGAI